MVHCLGKGLLRESLLLNPLILEGELWQESQDKEPGDSLSSWTLETELWFFPFLYMFFWRSWVMLHSFKVLISISVPLIAGCLKKRWDATLCLALFAGSCCASGWKTSSFYDESIFFNPHGVLCEHILFHDIAGSLVLVVFSLLSYVEIVGTWEFGLFTWYDLVGLYFSFNIRYSSYMVFPLFALSFVKNIIVLN